MSLDATRLTLADYRASVEVDAQRLRDAAEGHLELPVPTCPGWSMADLVAHVGAVYDHKRAAVELGRRPEDGEWQRGPAEGEPVLDWCDRMRAGMAAAVYGGDSSAPAWTFWPAEQTVGFWQRRMAQETVVHRVDAELAREAAGGPPPAPIGPRLAADGVDEVLGWLAWPWDEDPRPEAAGRTVRVDGRLHAWRVLLEDTSVTVVGVGVAAAAGGVGSNRPDEADDAYVRGAPADLLLHLWGRPVPDGAVVEGGDPIALTVLKHRLAAVSG
ncbi:MAG: maleylpyruvate isomerase N-terminal domain-containing protein [Candidatus Nanopelagicales bacterium]